MSEGLPLRRHLYEQLNQRPSRRRRRELRRQLVLLSGLGPFPRAGPDDGAAGVREPRRPRPSPAPATQALDL